MSKRRKMTRIRVPVAANINKQIKWSLKDDKTIRSRAASGANECVGGDWRRASRSRGINCGATARHSPTPRPRLPYS